MRVYYSPEYGGHVYLGMHQDNDCLMDSQVCDTMGLVGMLELRLGIYVEEQPGDYRTVQYFKAMTEYMKQNPDNALAKSFKLSGLGTAEEALHWRDSLIMDKWKPEKVNASSRLDVLAGTEQFFNCPGMADRLITLLQTLKGITNNEFFSDLEIALPCNKELLHPTLQELLDALTSLGATIACAHSNLGRGNNLTNVTELLLSDSTEKINLQKGDDSFQIYRFNDKNAADEYLAYKGETLGADLWINSDNKTLDNWIRLMGKPTMGSDMLQSTPQIMQLMVLGIDLMKEPLNIKSLISWLYMPMHPMGKFFGTRLAENIIAEGGYRNESCKKMVADYIDGKYTYHDPDIDAKLTDAERRRIAEAEKKGAQIQVDTYLPPFEPADDGNISTARLEKYLTSLTSWARRMKFMIRDDKEKYGWIAQLERLAEMCETFVLLIKTAGVGEYIDVQQIDSWISTLYKGEAIQQYRAQKGSWTLIDDGAKMASRSDKTVWVSFSDYQRQMLDLGFLYPTEKDAIKEHLSIWDEDKETKYRQMMRLIPFLNTDEQLILVVTDYTDGEATPKSPIMVRLENQIENLHEFTLSPNLLGEETKGVNLINNNGNHSVSYEIKQPDLLNWPDHFSPTVAETLVSYPLDFLMQYLLKITGTGTRCIKDMKATMGTVAHAVIEHLFAPRDGKLYSTADEIEYRIQTEFDDQVKKQIEACGALLLLPENKLDGDLMKEQLSKCLANLLDVMRENGLKVTGCEHLVQSDMGLLENENGWDMKGYIDMTLEDEAHHPVVFDFKWTSSNYYRDKLTENRSIQLELYRAMLTDEKRNTVERTAYYIMPEGHLYSKESFKGIHCTQVEAANFDNIVEQVKHSLKYRMEQLNKGVVENGEVVDISALGYYEDTESEGLFPLKENENGNVSANRFSDYTIFK